MTTAVKEAVWDAMVRISGTTPKNEWPQGFNIGAIRKHTEGKPPLADIDTALKELATDGLMRKVVYRHQLTDVGHAQLAIQTAQAA